MSTGTAAVPYPGLRAFSRDESHLFFGREGSISSMVDKLAATRFLAVLGASGSGKSSLVYTGLLDALELGLHPAGSNWLVAAMRPGGAPMRNLAATLLRARGDDVPDAVDIDVLAAGLRRGPRSVAEWCEASNLEPGQNLLLLVDQFEELFRYSDYAGREEAEAFARLLIETANARDGEGRPLPIAICLTMRSEYLGACAMIPGLAERINDGLFLTPRMTRDECRAAIEGPAAVSGFSIEPQLVTQLLNDMAELAPWDADAESDQLQRLAQRADQLPLMQHLLNRLWLRAQARTKKGKPLELTHADYRALGGLRGALDSHGAEVMAELGPGAEHAAECVFRSLVSGTSLATAVRRPCRFSELAVNAHDRDMAVRIVEAFRAPSCNFLQPAQAVPLADDTVVDISHESLIRQWQRLSSWFELEAESSVIWRRLLAEQEAYAAGKGDLLTGLTLANRTEWWERERPSAAWAARHGGRYDEVESYFRASVDAEQAQASATAIRTLREKRRLRISLAGVSALAVLAIGGAAYGLNQADVASGAKQAAEERLEEARDAKDRAAEALVIADTQRAVAAQRATAEEAAKKRAQDAERRAQAAQADAEKRRAEAQQAADRERKAAEETRKFFEDIGGAIGSNDVSLDLNRDRFRQRLFAVLPPEYRPASREGVDLVESDGSGPSTSALVSQVSTILYNFAAPGTASRNAALGPDERAQALEWYSSAQEGVGDYRRALDADIQAFNIGSQETARLGGWERLSRKLLLATLSAAYDVAWFGNEVGFESEGRSATDYLLEVGSHFKPDNQQVKADPQLAARLAEISNLESTIMLDSGEARSKIQDQRAISMAYGAIARDGEDDIVHNRYRYHLYERNLANLYDGDERARLIGEACKSAEQVGQLGWNPKKRQLARQAPLALGSCARLKLGVGDPDALEVAQRARAMLNEALTWDNQDQDLLLERSNLAMEMAQTINWRDGCTDECFGLYDLARADFLAAWGDRSRVLASGSDLSNLFDRLLDPDTFSDPDSRGPMIVKLRQALQTSSAAFPKGKAVNLGLARINQMRAQSTDLTLADREQAYKEATGALKIYSDDQDPRDSYLGWWLCAIQSERVELHRQDGFQHKSRVELGSEIADDCLRFAQRNPWHIYAQSNAIYGLEGLVPSFYDPPDPKLMPYLEYASTWGSPSATEYLHLYAEEHHVNRAKRELLSDRLDLAASYRFSYSLVGQDDSDRPNYLTLFQQPPDQPLFASRLAEYHRLFGQREVDPDALHFIERIETISRELGTSFPRLADSLSREAAYHPLKRDDESEYAMALRLLDFQTKRTPVDARGVAFDGYDPTTLGLEPTKGLPSFALFVNDAIVEFSSKAAMDQFETWHLPAVNGYDPVALADGQLVAGNPLIAFRWGNTTYLFASEANRETWVTGPETMGTRAVEQWLKIFPDFSADLYSPSGEAGASDDED